MFKQYLLFLIGLAAVTHIATTNTTGLCFCYCCDGQGCNPPAKMVGSFAVASCAGLICFNSCRENFPVACDTIKGGVEALCQDVTDSSSTTTSTAPSSASTTLITTSTTTESTSPTTSSLTRRTTQTILTTVETSTRPIAIITEYYNDASTIRESSTFVALLITSILIIAKNL